MGQYIKSVFDLPSSVAKVILIGLCFYFQVDSEDEAAQAAAALTGRATLGRATHLLADGGIVFEVHNE